MIRAQIIAAQEVPQEAFVLAVPNLRVALESAFGLTQEIRSAEIGIRRSESVRAIEMQVVGIPNGKDGLILAIGSVVTTFGHEYSGVITDRETGETHIQRIFVEA